MQVTDEPGDGHERRAAAPILPTSDVLPYLMEAERMRQEAVAQSFRMAMEWVTWPVSGPSPEAEHDLRSALTVIRTTAEMLRDGPDLETTDRETFARMLLDEEARLERLLLRPDQRAPL